MPEKSTIYEVARRSGVSTATVSRVMGDGTGFSEATRTKVLEAAAALHWFPSGSARGLASRRNGIVGLLFPDFDSSDEDDVESPLYVDQVIRGAEKAATADGDAVLIAATRGKGGRDLALAVASKCDGIVVVARALGDRDIATLAHRLPVVVLSDRVGQRAHVDAVGVDNRGGLHGLVGHLVEHHGYTDLAFVGGPADSPDAQDRFAGFREALAAAGLRPPDAPDAYGGFTEAGGSRAVAELLDRREADGRTPPRGIVCGNDEMAVGALGVLAARGLRVPDDVAITGFDDLAAARHVRPPLTTVAQPIRELGAEAVRTVVARLADADAPRRSVVLPTDVVLRGSCGCTARRAHHRDAHQRDAHQRDVHHRDAHHQTRRPEGRGA